MLQIEYSKKYIPKRKKCQNCFRNRSFPNKWLYVILKRKIIFKCPICTENKMEMFG